jgi:hypothetical protein
VNNLCDYCETNPNPVTPDQMGMCQECSDYFDENPSGPALQYMGKWYEPGDDGYEALLKLLGQL